MNTYLARNQSINMGFTLIELVIVVTTIAILSAVAYPSYTQYTIRAKRAEGRTMLLDVAARQERYYSDCNRYAGTTSTAGNDCAAGKMGLASSSSENSAYNLGIALGANNQSFTLTAKPTFTDADCGNLTLTSAGTKGESGTSNTKTCWGK